MNSFSAKRRVRSLMLALLAGLAAIALKSGWSAYRSERQLAFAPHALNGATAGQSGLAGAVDVTYGQSEGAQLKGWYIPSTNGAAILFVHGASGDRRSLAREAALLRNDGYGVLLVDLPGQGESGGRITCGRSEEAAVEAAVEWLAHTDTERLVRIGVLSLSLGSHFVARVAAVDKRARAVVLEAPSTSIIDRMRESHPHGGWLTLFPASIPFFLAGTNPWRNQARDAVAAIAPRPLLLITGTRDPMATPAMARELLARAGTTARLELFETGHGGYWEADEKRYSNLLRSFFGDALLK